jgi:hypothetical protein
MLLEYKYGYSSWHAARKLPAFYNVIESNLLLLEIYSGMPISRINTLAAYQCWQNYSSGMPIARRYSVLNNWHSAKKNL